MSKTDTPISCPMCIALADILTVNGREGIDRMLGYGKTPCNCGALGRLHTYGHPHRCTETGCTHFTPMRPDTTLSEALSQIAAAGYQGVAIWQVTIGRYMGACLDASAQVHMDTKLWDYCTTPEEVARQLAAKVQKVTQIDHNPFFDLQ